MHLKHFLVIFIISSAISISSVSCRWIDSDSQPTDGSTTELTSEITVSNATEKIETPLVLQSSRYGQAATFSPPIVVIIWVVCCWYCVCRRYCEKKTQNVIMNQNTTATATPAAPQVILQQPIVNQNIAASPQQVPMQQWAPQPPPQPWAPQLPPQQGDPQPPPQQFGIPNVKMTE